MRIRWAVSVHDAPMPAEANVLLERGFAEPVNLEALQAKEDARRWCLDVHNVRYVRAVFSNDQKRM